MITPSHDGLQANEGVGGVRVLCGGGRKGAFWSNLYSSSCTCSYVCSMLSFTNYLTDL